MAETNGTLSTAEKKERRQKLLRRTKDFAPSTRQQAGGWVGWQKLEEILGQPFDATKIPYSKLYQMRRDPMLAFAMHFIKVPLVRAPWYIKCEDARIAAAADKNLRNIIGRYILQHTLSYDFGSIPIVKRYVEDFPDWTYIDPLADADEMEKPVWDEGPNVPMLNFKHFVALRPERAWPLWNSKGEFNGIEYNVETPVAFPHQMLPGGRNDAIKVPLEYALWITNDKDSVFGNPYGFPLLAHAYKYWWSYWYTWQLQDRAFESNVDPSLVVYHPEEEFVDEDTGEITKNADKALAFGDAVRSNGTIALPNTAVESLDGKMTALREWAIDYLKPTTDFEALQKRFEYLDVMKLRSLWIPEQALLEGKGGTSSRNVAEQLGDVFFESQVVRMQEIDDTINRLIIRPWVDVNFPEYRGEVKKVTRGFGHMDTELSRQLIQVIGQTNPEQLEVDTRSILEAAGIPLLSRAQVQQRDAKIQKQLEMEAAASQPPETEPVPGQAAGVVQVPDAGSATGFSMKYIRPREVIRLSEARLPRTVHTEDEEIRSAAAELMDFWQERYAEQYESFASWLESQNSLELAEEDPKERAARLVERWRDDAAKVGRAIKRTMDIVRRVVFRAGQLELDKAKQNVDIWSLDNPEVRAWMEDHGASRVARIDDTTRQELRTFLADQMKDPKTPFEIAQAVREHFKEWPSWKAQRLARTEVRDAYNAGTLLAGMQAGIKKVQAFDAMGGLTGQTDEHCIERNGKFFDIADALNEDEHPNGTLAWRLIPRVDLSMEYVDVVPGEIPNAMAAFDNETGTVYLRKGIPDDARISYLDSLGRQLAG